MVRIFEDDAKRLLSEFGLIVPAGERVLTPSDAERISKQFSDSAVVKALVPTGRRGKANLVRMCTSPVAAAEATTAMIGRQFEAYTVGAVLVEERVEIRAEYYLSIGIDPVSLSYVLLLGSHGGVDVEEFATGIERVDVSPGHEPTLEMLMTGWRRAGVSEAVERLSDATMAAFRAFRTLDATLLEINPLAVTSTEDIVAVGVMLAVDDAAMRRQPAVSAVAVEGSERAWRPETNLEARVAAINADARERGSARYLELEGGDIGFLCGGGGASLLLFDAVVAACGQPANYSEFGGNPTEQRVYDLARVVLDKPGVRGLFVAHNITNNTQVDVVARGVTRALVDAAPRQPFPVVAREAGVNDEEGRRIFEAAGIEYLGDECSLDRAAQRMVARMREVQV